MLNYRQKNENGRRVEETTLQSALGRCRHWRGAEAGEWLCCASAVHCHCLRLHCQTAKRLLRLTRVVIVIQFGYCHSNSVGVSMSTLFNRVGIDESVPGENIVSLPLFQFLEITLEMEISLTVMASVCFSK